MENELSPIESTVLIEQMESFNLATVNAQELKDEIVLKYINQVLPIVKKIAPNKNQLYKIDIPLKKLVEAKGHPGKYRAMIIENGKIAQNAMLVPVDAIVPNAMALAAVAVNQYYMAEINSKLGHIVESLQDITDFQKNEFQGKIRSLVVNISSMIQFSEEYNQEDNIKQLKLIELGRYRSKVTELLEQVHLSIDRLIKNNKESDFTAYQKATKKLSEEIFYQKLLLELLNEIAKLELVFAQGQVTKESSHHVSSHYLSEANRINNTLSQFHKAKIKYFKIDLKAGNRNQEGTMKVVADVAREVKKGAPKGVAGALISPLGIALGAVAAEVDKQISRVSISKKQLKMMKHQLNVKYSEEMLQLPNKYHQNVQILVEDEKVYYLLPK